MLPWSSCGLLNISECHLVILLNYYGLLYTPTPVLGLYLSFQPVEKITYGDNSTIRYRNILRHELELKWIKLLQTPHPLGFNDNIYHQGNISRLPDFDVFFSLLDIRKRNNRSHGKRKNGNLNAKINMF